ncbi:MAG: lipase maturation factor family protein, partial [Acidobacteriaceae bacterium]
MNWTPARTIHSWFDASQGTPDHHIARWIFLRALGLIYFSAFFSLIFQIRGLIGPQGVLPAGQYLAAVEHGIGSLRFWFAPTLLWFSSSSNMLMALCWVGIVASLLVVANVWPRTMLIVCFVCFLSFVSAAGDFSGYQSDGMLLEAGFISLFFAPAGFFPGWGRLRPPIRASLFLLLWEWFRIYFESGVVKLASGDPEWRHLTAMDQYYQNGPLPTWIGWYVQHLPHWFQASTVVATLGMELVLVWMLFLPRRWRIVCFFFVTPWQIAVIMTGNYAFLNYIVLALGFLLLDDRFLVRFVPARWRSGLSVPSESATQEESNGQSQEERSDVQSQPNEVTASIPTSEFR